MIDLWDTYSVDIQLNCCEVRNVDDDYDDDGNDDDEDDDDNNNNNNSTWGTKQVGPRRSDLPYSYLARFLSTFGLATNSPCCCIFLYFPLSLDHSSGIVGYHKISSYYILWIVNSGANGL